MRNINFRGETEIVRGLEISSHSQLILSVFGKLFNRWQCGHYFIVRISLRHRHYYIIEKTYTTVNKQGLCIFIITLYAQSYTCKLYFHSDHVLTSPLLMLDAM